MTTTIPLDAVAALAADHRRELLAAAADHRLAAAAGRRRRQLRLRRTWTVPARALGGEAA
jgi:hypothetical protein